jgi:hypothetical protein
MKLITNLEDIKEACDLVDLARELDIDMQRSGSHWAIRCPNHRGGQYDRHIGNCYITKNHKNFICKSCGNKGDALTLVQQATSCSFLEAVKFLSKFVGVELSYIEEGKEYTSNKGEKDVLRRIISTKEQEFLGLKNSAVYGVSELLDPDEFDLATEFNATPVTYENNLLFYYTEKTYLTNPLKKIASQNYDLYLKIIESAVFRKYEKLKKISDVWGNSPFSAESFEAIKREFEMLRTIYKNIGGNISRIKLPEIKNKNLIDLSSI